MGIPELILILGIMAMLGVLAFLVLGVTAVFAAMLASSVARKGRMGINLRREDCPECGLAMPTFRRPENFRQFMWGGWTCPGCGTELDKWGRVV